VGTACRWKILKALCIPGLALIFLVFYLFVVILGEESFTVAWRRLLLRIETGDWGTAQIGTYLAVRMKFDLTAGS